MAAPAFVTPAPERLQTERLVGERILPHHAAELAGLLQHPCVARTLSPSGLPPSDDALARRHAEKVEHWERHGFGLYAVRDRASGEVVAQHGLQLTFVKELAEVEIAWAVRPDRWREGLATEFAQAVLRMGFDRLSLPQIVAFTIPGNTASRRVMDKLDFRYETDFEHHGLPHALYRRARC